MRRVVLCVVVLLVWSALALPAQPASAPGPSSDASRLAQDASGQGSLLQSVKSAGIIGVVILLESLVAVGLVVEHFISIRRTRFAPEELVQQVGEQIESENINAAMDLCQQSDSLLGMTILAGLQRAGGVLGFYDMQSAMQEAAQREISRMYRKLEYLTSIAATAPMLGLLGTVTGMIQSFNAIGLAHGASKAQFLAEGIGQALVTTCMGLVVAIPAMFFASLFRNRIDGLVSETECVCESLIAPLRK